MQKKHTEELVVHFWSGKCFSVMTAGNPNVDLISGNLKISKIEPDIELTEYFCVPHVPIAILITEFCSTLASKRLENYVEFIKVLKGEETDSYIVIIKIKNGKVLIIL